jgi:hypothetical protein
LEVLRLRSEVGVNGGGKEPNVPSFSSSTDVFSSVDEGGMDVDLEEDEEMGSTKVDETTTEMREAFRLSLSAHLFGWDEVLRLRMRLSMADFAWVS